VAVGVERYGDVGVPEHLRDDLGVYASREQQRRTRVPEVVEAYVGQASPPEEWLPVPVVEIVGVGGVAPGVRKHEPALRPGAVRWARRASCFSRYGRGVCAPGSLDRDYAAYARMKS